MHKYDRKSEFGFPGSKMELSRRTVLSSILAVGASAVSVKTANAQYYPLPGTDPATVVKNATYYFNLQLVDSYLALIAPNVQIISVNQGIPYSGSIAIKLLRSLMTTPPGARFYLDDYNLTVAGNRVTGRACWRDFNGTQNDHLKYQFGVVNGLISYMWTQPDGLGC
jgi:hypothetical protein